MWKNMVNFNYALGFIIVAVLIYLSIVMLASIKSEKYEITIDSKNTGRVTTILTNEGIIKLDNLLTEHYLDRMKSNLEYLAKHVDKDKCEKIKDQLTKARESLQTQILNTSEIANISQQSDIQEERRKLRERAGSMGNIMFSNEQNPDDASSIITEMMLDMETLMYLVKIIPDEIKSIDLRDVDLIAKLIYEQACLPKTHEPNLNEDITPTIYPSENSPGDGLFISANQQNPSSFDTFADFNKHQNLSDENNISVRPTNMSYMERKKNLKNIRKTSMSLGGEMNNEKHKASNILIQKTSKLKEQHKDPIRDRVTNAQETFISAHPTRYKKTKSSLVEDYNAIEDHLVFPALAFAY